MAVQTEIITEIADGDRKEVLAKNYYFDNEICK